MLLAMIGIELGLLVWITLISWTFVVATFPLIGYLIRLSSLLFLCFVVRCTLGNMEGVLGVLPIDLVL